MCIFCNPSTVMKYRESSGQRAGVRVQSPDEDTRRCILGATGGQLERWSKRSCATHKLAGTVHFSLYEVVLKIMLAALFLLSTRDVWCSRRNTPSHAPLSFVVAGRAGFSLI